MHRNTSFRSAFAYSIGTFIAGLTLSGLILSGEASAAAPSCRSLAADPYDTATPGEGTMLSAINHSEAIGRCESELKSGGPPLL